MPLPCPGQICLTDPTGAPLVVQRDGVAMTHFDGTGGLTQVDYVISSPNAKQPPTTSTDDPVTGFHTMETGTYKVYSDCTGTFTINSPGVVISVKFVLSDHGRAIHTIVTSLVMPADRAGGAGPDSLGGSQIGENSGGLGLGVESRAVKCREEVWSARTRYRWCDCAPFFRDISCTDVNTRRWQ